MSSPQGSPDPTVADILRGTDIGSLLDRPVNDILRDLGLSTLPQLPAMPPLPGMPVLPVIDLTALTRPLTDLAQAFGTGQLSGASVDPTQVLSTVSSALQQIMTMASSLMAMASGDWQGAGATSALEKGTAAQADAVQLQTQNGAQKMVLGGAATSVATGAATMATIIAKFLASVAASAPFLVTPPGQAFLLAMATETAAEATAVTAKTKAELTVHSANMTTAGQKVKVTNAPSGVDSLSQVTQLLSVLSPLASAANTGVQQVQSIAQTLTATDTTDTVVPVDDALDPSKVGGTSPGGGIPLTGLGASAATQLSQWTGTRSAAAPPAAPPAAEPAATTRATAMSGPGMMAPPMAGAGLAPHSNEGEADAEIRSQMVTGEHGDDVVGDLGNTGVPVVGAVGSASPRVPTSTD
ncbi:hypothetical protein OHB26_06955 [Nocardia sp. NBC_01503]|uniref:hypothetical protein n=1 Tax=Nocardia sp. NBC_01503 TaxID=2975997 RepID=UPI002E7BBD16|nr:hypothetical protein [Nocardia sp. NBC_01503]WTL33948.1 hypothetical protein OHB26_06955 [Nocardia sp. NBC_01503]